MAQKKKVMSAAKATAKPAARKAPVKVAAAAPAKPIAKAKAQASAARKPAAPEKVKAPAVAAAGKSKKAPLPIKAEIKTAPAAAPAVSAKKPIAGLLKAAVAAAAGKPVAGASTAARAVPAAVQKTGGQKLTAPLQPSAQPVPTPKAIAEKAAAARQMLAAQKKPVSQRHGFKANEFIVYPAHGVGRIIGIEEQEIAGMSLELFVINFEKEKLTLRVPTGKLQSVGMRKLADEGVVKKAMEILKGRARIKRTMWSRRAQEYVAKINSGDLVSIAEVVRDLYRSEAQPEQSYSERQLYEDALDRMAREIAAVEKLDERGAVQRITDVLSKSAKSRRLSGESESVGEAA
ncbi:MAG TPA: CarD family transcriptional regulator [Hyphomicrobium sp.]|nr:CarD family transcriptional regulator [Hyphomicrobium sp.]